MGALADIARQGKALYAGISSYGAEQTQVAATALAQFGVRCLVHQTRYSLFNRTIEAELLPLLAARGSSARGSRRWRRGR
jgi:L-glyceraldehyde 3-phosphate reductase